jgi:hypothetical protein
MQCRYIMDNSVLNILQVYLYSVKLFIILCHVIIERVVNSP